MLARNDSGGWDRFFMRAIIGDLCFRCYSSAELLSNIIYTSFDDFFSEISEVSYTRDNRAGLRAPANLARVFFLQILGKIASARDSPAGKHASVY